MGFIYKLTPQISAFIIEQKRNQPKATCQAISGMIYSRFGTQVSKSSVHFLLKQSHVIVPRARKVKEKFEIPAQKKEQISKALAPFVLIGSTLKKQAPLSEPGALIVPPEPVISPPFYQEKKIKTVGDIFLKCALYDLSFKPIFGIQHFSDVESIDFNQIKFEWKYLAGLVYAIKIQLEDGSIFYVDPRFQNLSQKNNTLAELAAPIERVACEAADHILNNIKPLMIRSYDTDPLGPEFFSFLAAMANQEGQKIKNIALIDQNQKTLAEFNHPLICPRYFMIAVDSKVSNFQWFIEKTDNEGLWEISAGQTLKLLKLQDNIVITNLKQKTYKEISELYLERHPKENLNLSALPMNELGPASGLKTQLQNRARMFFPSKISSEDLEKIIQLTGYEESIVDDKKETVVIKTHVTLNRQSPLFELVQQATQNINALNIINEKNQKIIIAVDENSD